MDNISYGNAYICSSNGFIYVYNLIILIFKNSLIINKMEGCTFPLDYEYSKFMFYTSFLFGISFLLAIYLSNIYASIYWFLLCVSSTNHWRNPDYDFKRNIDLFIVFIGLFNTIYYTRTLKTEFYKIMFIYLFICIIFLKILTYIYCYFNSTKWIIFHMTMHLYVFIMSLFMFVNQPLIN